MGRLISICMLASVVGFTASIAKAASQFDGNWKSNCYTKSAQGQSEYGIDQLTITDNTLMVSSDVFSDSSCSTKAIATVQTGESLALSTDSNTPQGAEDADLTLTTLTLAFHAAEYISYMNQEQFCGYDNWVIDQPQDVAGKDCANQTIPSEGTENYDLIGLDSTGALHMGLITNDLPGTSAATRPTSLDTSITYSKVSHMLFSALR
jgi:hypothetical protein